MQSNSFETHLDLTKVKLHGRHSQIETLLDAYKRSTSARQVVLISGCAGVGKSALVEHTFRNKETIYHGKFDKLNPPSTPYAVIVEILTSLCCTLRHDDHKVRVNVKLSPYDAAILSRLVPEIYQVIDCDPTDTKILQGDNTHKLEQGLTKLKLAVRSFLRGVCSMFSSVASKSLVLFLDDLQWADANSLHIIKFVLDDDDITAGLLFIGSYRGSEIGEADDCSSLAAFINDIQASTTNPPNAFIHVDLTNLDKPAIQCLIADLTETNPNLVQPLSDLIYAKTSGNCFFALEVIRHVSANDFLTYCESTGRSNWDLEKIRLEVDVSSNVVDFMTKRIQFLTAATRDILQFAACLGSTIDIELLGSLYDTCNPSTEQPSLADALKDAAQEHLIEINSDQTRFKFSHDGIQSAIYDLMPAGSERHCRHLQIGRCLQDVYERKRENFDDSQAEHWCFILAVDQLNRGREKIDDDDKRVPLARFNLMAAKQVMKKSAFRMATGFLRIGIELLGRNLWDIHYQLALDLQNTLLLALFSDGLMDESLLLITDIYAHSRCEDDQRKAQFLHIEILASLNRLSECIDLGLSVLRELGHHKIPRKPGLRHIIPALVGTKMMIKGRSDEELLAIPACNDPKIEAVARILAFLCPVSFFTAEGDLVPILVCRMVKLSLCHGVNEYTPYAFASYGMVLTVGGDFEEAFRFALLALKLLKQTGKEHVRTNVKVYGLVYHLKRPIIDCNDHTLQAYQSAFLQGDLQYAGQASFMHCISRYVAGLELENLVKDISCFCNQLQQYNQGVMRNSMLCLQRSILELVGSPSEMAKLTNGIVLDDDAFEVHIGENAKIELVELLFWMLTSWSRFYLGDLDSALMFAEKCWSHREGLQVAVVYSVPFFLFNALIALDSWKTRRKMRHWRIFRKNHRELLKWAKGGNLNSIHLVKMLDAELLVVGRKSKPDAVKKAYDAAIALASRSGFLHDAALANERLGQYYLRNNMDIEWGLHYIARAKDLYSDWGATAKVEQLLMYHGGSASEDIACNGSVQERSVSLKGRSQVSVIALAEQSRTLPLISIKASDDQSSQVLRLPSREYS